MFQAPPRAPAPPMKLDMRKWESLTVKEQDAVRKLPFPRKLHYILGQEDLLQQCGPNGLRKAGTKEQMETMLNKYCNTSKYESFLRQLSVYGFKRTQVDDYKDVYQHEDFIIGNCERIHSIERPRKKRQHDEDDNESDSLEMSRNLDDGEANPKRIKQTPTVWETRKLLEQSYFVYKERSYAELVAATKQRTTPDHDDGLLMTGLDLDPDLGLDFDPDLDNDLDLGLDLDPELELDPDLGLELDPDLDFDLDNDLDLRFDLDLDLLRP